MFNITTIYDLLYILEVVSLISAAIFLFYIHYTFDEESSLKTNDQTWLMFSGRVSGVLLVLLVLRAYIFGWNRRNVILLSFLQLICTIVVLVALFTVYNLPIDNDEDMGNTRMATMLLLIIVGFFTPFSIFSMVLLIQDKETHLAYMNRG